MFRPGYETFPILTLSRSVSFCTEICCCFGTGNSWSLFICVSAWVCLHGAEHLWIDSLIVLRKSWSIQSLCIRYESVIWRSDLKQSWEQPRKDRMLKTLTKKLRRHSLNEIHPFQLKVSLYITISHKTCLY